jgi:hypothetical protein
MSSIFKGALKFGKSVGSTAKGVVGQTASKVGSRTIMPTFQSRLFSIADKTAKSVRPKLHEHLQEKIVDRISDDLLYKIVLLEYLQEAEKDKRLSSDVKEHLVVQIETIKGQMEGLYCLCAKTARSVLTDKHSIYECYGCQSKKYLNEIKTVVDSKKSVIKEHVKQIIDNITNPTHNTKSKNKKETKTKSKASSKSRKTRKLGRQ